MRFNDCFLSKTSSAKNKSQNAFFFGGGGGLNAVPQVIIAHSFKNLQKLTNAENIIYIYFVQTPINLKNVIIVYVKFFYF